MHNSFYSIPLLLNVAKVQVLFFYSHVTRRVSDKDLIAAKRIKLFCIYLAVITETAQLMVFPAVSTYFLDTL